MDIKAINEKYQMTMDEIVKMMMMKSIEQSWITQNLVFDQRKRVNILGLAWLEYWFRGIKCREDIPGDVWAINDFYRALKWLKNVDKSFAIHPYKDFQVDNDRYQGDYQKIFKEDVKDLIVTDIKLKEFFNRDVTIMDYVSMHDKYSDLTFGSTLDYLIIYAVEQGYEIIYLYGVFMQNDHHVIYAESLLKTINKARELGIEVVFAWEEEMKALPSDIMTQERYLDLCYQRNYV